MNKSKIFIFLLILLPLIASYWKLPLQFFQQDEWHHFGQEYVWHSTKFGKYLTDVVLKIYGFRFLPFAYIFNYFQFSVFKTNALGYAIISLLLHIINSLLAVILVYIITKKTKIAYVAGVLFSVSVIPLQAVTWLIQHTTTLPAMTFSIISAIYFFKYLENTKNNIVYSLIFLVVASFFKETALFLYPFFVSVLLLRRFSLSGNKNNNTNIVIAFVLFAVLHFMFLLIIGKSVSNISTVRISNVNQQTIAVRIVSVPAQIISQTFFTQEFFISISKAVSTIKILQNLFPEKGTTEFDIFLESAVSRGMLYLISFLIIIFVAILYKKTNNKDTKKSIFILASWIISASIPLVFVQTQFTYLESRYLYIPILGASALIAVFADEFIKNKKIFWILIFILLILNIYQDNIKLGDQLYAGSQRKNILETISRKVPILPKKTIFYIDSDTSYYGLAHEEKILPFQSGFGQNLLVWYHERQSFPLEFFKNDFLWDIKSQGYKEVNGVGFGYFRNFDLLREALRQYNLSSDSVIAFRWNSNLNTLVDITDKTRKDLEI